MSTELFPSLNWCWKGLSQRGTFSRCLWVQEQSEEQFFSIFLLQTSSSKASIASCKILVTRWWQATKHFHVFVERMWPFVLIHESLCSRRSSAHGAAVGLCPKHSHSHSGTSSQWFPSSTWTLTRSSSSPRQLCCEAAAWRLWHGLAQLGSAGSRRRWQGLLCVACSCAAAAVCFVGCWKLWGFFHFAKEFYGYLVVWLG